MKLLIALAAVALAAGLSGCTQKSENPYASKPEVRAEGDIKASFYAIAMPPRQTDGLTIDKFKIVIDKKALEKEFLLRTSIISQTLAPGFHGLGSKVVAFRHRGDKVYMMEATVGHVVTNEMPANLVLAEFAILDQTADTLTIDFNAGMENLYMADGWTASDFSGRYYDADAHFTSAKARFSYLENIEFTTSNVLYIRQIASLEKSGEYDSNMPVEIRYYLSPYRPDPAYSPFKSKSFDRMGFFEIPTQMMLDGSQVTYATRFNPAKPIVFAISSNTPAEYKDAVKDGVLYWNSMMGKDAIQVVDAPAGVMAPDPNFNIVQWVTWNTAGAAYADAQMDPRTGEIMNAQVFMTSVFPYGAKNRVRQYMRLSTPQPKSLKAFKLAGFEVSQNGCRYPLTEEMAAEMDAQIAGATPEQLNKIANDYIREVVAHEIGHTLGLRHNFAGSLAVNYDPNNVSTLWSDYMAGKGHDDIIPSSSVMEYSRPMESYFIGDQISRKKVALPYDDKVIRTLYKGETFKAADMPLFCTDSHAMFMPDCLRFDIGRSNVEYADYDFKDKKKRFAATLIENFIWGKAPPPGYDAQDMDEVSVSSADSYATSLMAIQADVFKTLISEPRSIRIERSRKVVDGIAAKEVQKEIWDYTLAEIHRLGGWKAVLQPVSAAFGAELKQEFLAKLMSPTYRKGEDVNGKAYELTDADVAVIEQRVSPLFDQIDAAMKKAQLKLWGSATKLANHDASIELSRFLAEQAVEVLTALEPASIKVTIEKASEKGPVQTAVTLPKFKYNVETRLLAVAMLAPQRATAIDWGMIERANLVKKMNEFYKNVLTVELEKVDPTTMSNNDAIKWILESKKVMRSIQVIPSL